MKMIQFKQFFRFMTPSDKALMIIGTICAIVCGCLLPSIGIAMGEITNTFDPDNTEDEIRDTMRILVIYICIVGVGCWIFGYIYYAFWQHLAENISFNLRSRYLKAIMK